MISRILSKCLFCVDIWYWVITFTTLLVYLLVTKTPYFFPSGDGHYTVYVCASHSSRPALFCTDTLLLTAIALKICPSLRNVWHVCFSDCAEVSVYCHAHACTVLFFRCVWRHVFNQTKPPSWFQIRDFTLCCVCVPGLVRRLEPNPQQAREEETIRRRHSDGHQSNGVGPTGSACQEHQQVHTDVRR